MGRTNIRSEQITDGTITDADVATANKDGATGTASMRTLGTGAQQAAAGNHTHAHNTLTGLTSGDDHTQYALLQGRSGGTTIYGDNTGNPDGYLALAGGGTRGHIKLDGSVAFDSVVTPAQITADQNDYFPTGLHATFFLRLNSDAARNITGFDAPTSFADGALLLIQNVGSFDITLKHENASSLAANRFHFSTSADMVVKNGYTLLIFYDNVSGQQRWKDLINFYHSNLAGLANDDHTQYAKLTGRSGGQILVGGTASNEQLKLRGSGAQVGQVVLDDGVAFAFGPNVSLVADTNDWAPTNIATRVRIRLTTDTNTRKLTGIDTTNNNPGRFHILQNSGSNSLIISHEDTGSTAANRFSLPGGRNYILESNAAVSILYDNTSSRWRLLDNQLTPALPTLYRQGLAWKRNGTDTTNDVDIAAGSCRDSTDTYNIVIGSALTKQLDVAWAAGNNAGGLDTGSRANNTWYYIWAIARTDTGATDILLSVSSSAPTMPTNYDKKRLIGAIRTGASLLSQVAVRGNYVMYLDPTTNGLDVSDTTLTTSKKNYTLNYVPPIGSSPDFIQAEMNFHLTNASSATVWISNPDLTDAAPSTTAAPIGSMQIPAANNPVYRQIVEADSSARISARSTVASTTIHGIVLGYYWPGNI